MKRSILVVVVLAFLLRVPFLAELPAGFTPDEASFGYDAYSLIKTASDQWGTPFPLVLESFGDFKAPLYTYLTIPSIALFGLTKFAVRLPNAVLGTFSVLTVYLLVNELFTKKKFGLVASFMLAVSPWHIMLSRGAFEANLSSFFMPLGFLLVLKARRNYKLLVLGSLLLGLNLFTYHSARFMTPLLVVLIGILGGKYFSKIPKTKFAFPGLVFLTFMALAFVTFFAGAGSRISERSILVGAAQDAAPKRLDLINRGVPPPIAKAIYNKYTEGTTRFITNFVTYLSPTFLFSRGPLEATYGMIPGQGVLYLFELPFLLAFVLSLIKKEYRQVKIIFLLWVCLGIIPAALSTGVGYAANRAAFMLPAIQIVSSVGAIELWNKVKRFSFAKSIVVFYALFSLFFVFAFGRKYYLTPAIVSEQAMLAGNLEVATWLKLNTSPTEKIIVSRGLSEPQIYVAFAYTLDPKVYQSSSARWNYRAYNVNWVDQIPVYNLGTFVFKNIEQELDLAEAHYVVARPKEFSSPISKVYSFKYSNGEEAVVVAKGKAGYYASN